MFAGVQAWLGYLNGPLEGFDRFGVPALLPSLSLQIFSCVVAFLLGHLIPIIPDPEESDRFLLWAALRSVLASLLVSTATFELMYLCSRLPVITDVSLSHSFRPWTRIFPMALGASVLPTVYVFLNNAVNGAVAKRWRQSFPGSLRRS
jgi:hypothetical protein